MPDTENRSIDPERIEAVAHAVHALCHGRSDVSLAADADAAAAARHFAGTAPITDSILAQRAALETAVTKRVEQHKRARPSPTQSRPGIAGILSCQRRARMDSARH